MVPGNLPSQLEILSTGQNYYETPQGRWQAGYVQLTQQKRNEHQITALKGYI